MYLVVPQLKNRQMEVEHGCFLPIGRRPQTSPRCHLKKKQDTSAQTHLRSKLRVKISIKIRLKELSLDITRSISKTYFQIKFSSAQKFTKIFRRSDACKVSCIKVNLAVKQLIVSRSCS